jgi:hypothetical protein
MLRALVCAGLVCLPGLAWAQSGASDARSVVSREGEDLTVRAFPAGTPFTLDGRLDEPVYGRVAPIDGFVQQEPRAGAPVTEKTDVWILFDRDNVYISARMWDSQPERIVGNDMRRDGTIATNDSFSVILDTFRDRRTAFLFITNPLGGLQDGHVTSEWDYNQNFDPIWYVKAARFEQGWSVEIAIPFKTLRYKSSGEQVWGVNFRRRVAWKGEISHLTNVPASFGGFAIMRLAQAATLVGVMAPEAGPNLMLKPYGIANLTTDRLANPPRENDGGGDAGFDVKYGLTKGLTADVTYNTDFAQVEDDQQQINLTRFGLFFPEKREFFLEGQGIFKFGAGGGDVPTMFFSRQIGLARGFAVPIRTGGRVTGKAGRFSIGLLDIQTGESVQAGARPTNYAVARVQRDILRRSSVGFIATSKQGGGADNLVVGADTNIALGLTAIDAHIARSRTPGAGTDSHSAYVKVDYNADRYGAKTEHLTVGADFNPALGFMRRGAFRKHGGFARFSPRPRGGLGPIRKFYFEGSAERFTGRDGRLQSSAVSSRTATDFFNNDTVSVTVAREHETLVVPFRLAPALVVPPGGYTFNSVTAAYTRSNASWFSGTTAMTSGAFYDGTRHEVRYSGRLGLSHRFGIEPGITLNWISLPWGALRTTLWSARPVFSFSPRATLAALVQYNSSASAFSANVRFRWEYDPGSDLFVVFNEGRTTESAPAQPSLQNRAFVVKLTRLIRF